MRVPNVLIFEDDVVLDARFQEKVAACLAELPSDWDMVYLGAFHRDDPIPVSKRIGRITRADSTYAYALNQKVFDAFIESNSRAIVEVDENNLKLQAEFKCYCFMPNVAWVESLHSDCAGTHVEPLVSSRITCDAGARNQCAHSADAFGDRLLQSLPQQCRRRQPSILAAS